MGALRGPSREALKRMSPLERRLYWAMVLVISGSVLGVWLFM